MYQICNSISFRSIKIVKLEFLIPIIIILVHLLAVYLGWQNSWSITIPKWILRITLSCLTLYSCLILQEEIQYSLRPQVLLFFLTSIVLCASLWIFSSQNFIWSIFTIQFLILGFGSIWFIFFFKLTRLF